MKKLVLAILMILSFKVQAIEWVYVSDMSKLKWQLVSSGEVYFRNLNEFNSAQGGCCYSYKLDTTTPAGKAMWSTILAKMAARAPLNLGFPQVGSANNVQTLYAVGIY
ncbi:hypothetical protein [Aliikangiella coralliicola]|uniref:Uncharacterized protein n=1 Tax=Aliikangiella coralliicola TaxID=2592383 RepID=A0A545UCT5_9GAMM|nr:hypothetical protein [Aliikangiella coralliicola]TQV87276.1 hypothetical protein FLL46_12550 [Aliikangiella coralliicola]